MAGQNSRSQDSTARSNRSNEIGWGVAGADEDLGPRRIVFAVLCSVVVAIGALFMYQSLSQGVGLENDKETIAATGGRYTVELCRVQDNADAWVDAANAYLDRRDLDAEAFGMESEDGESTIVCAGRFHEADSERVGILIDEVAGFTSPGGRMPFKNARVIELK
jgi:hypothetical protein